MRAWRIALLSARVAVAFALECLRRQAVFPCVGLETPDQGLDLAYVRSPREERVDCALVTSLGSGGVDIALLLQH